MSMRPRRRPRSRPRRGAGPAGGWRALARLAPLLVALALAGCTGVRLIADYDEQLDAGITAFQRKADLFLVSLERKAGLPEAAYEANRRFYDEARVDLVVLETRARARSANDLTVQQLVLLQETLDRLEALHRLGIKADQVAPLRSAIDMSCGAILKLELAKKRGEAPAARGERPAARGARGAP